MESKAGGEPIFGFERKEPRKSGVVKRRIANSSGATQSSCQEKETMKCTKLKTVTNPATLASIYRNYVLGRPRLTLALFLGVVWLCGLYIGVIHEIHSVETIYAQRMERTYGACNFPRMDPFDPVTQQYLEKHPPLKCTPRVPDVVKIVDDKIVVDDKKLKVALAKFNSSRKFAFCQYKVLGRKFSDDSKVEVISTSFRFLKSIKLNKTEEEIKVECYNTDEMVISRSYFAFINVKPERESVYGSWLYFHKLDHYPAETLSILMLGIDSLSKLHFARAMPKTRNFLMNDLGAIEMNKHNKLGYTTTHNIIPLLTGRTSEELEDDHKWGYHARGSMDLINEAFIWSDARRLGYRTGLLFDQVHATPFHYLKPGFQRKPVEHYLRAMVVDSDDDHMTREDKNCYGDEPEITKLYDYWLQLVHRYNSTLSNESPFFAFSFLTRLLHDDPSMAYAGDEVHLKFFKDLRATNALNNTVIILFSDHGGRNGKIRHTFTGEVEANAPLLSFVFPPWFRKKYTDLMQVFRTNQNRLTSFYDVYATLQDLLIFRGGIRPKGNRGERGISLFREIPLRRTCKDIEIPAEYCLCSDFTPHDLGAGLAKYLGTVLTRNIMALLRNTREVCAELTLKSVDEVLEEKNLEKAAQPWIRMFQLSIRTEPGDGQFEAKLSFNTETDKATVVGDITRTNTFSRRLADCVDSSELRNYCFCQKPGAEKGD